jgi:hypothetical protein
MNTKDPLNSFLERGCLPHQAEFAAKVLAPGSSKKHLLISVPGMGKAFVTAMICNHALAIGQAKRILVLTPSAFVSHWHDLIRRGNFDDSIVTVDRRKFREMEAAVGRGDSPWPATGIVIMSADFAKQADMAEALTRTKWDLLVVDEAQNLSIQSQRYMLLTGLLEGSPDMQVLFLGTTRVDTKSNRLVRGAATTVWSRESVRSHDGRPLFPKVHLEWLSYKRQPDEVNMLQLLQDSLRPMQASNASMQLIATTLMQTASSSLFALEQALNRLRLRRSEVMHGRDTFGENDYGLKAVVADELTAIGYDADAVRDVVNLASDLLQNLKDVETDSKFDRLLEVLKTPGLTANSDRRVCVFTRYVDTATYLESALSEHHPRVATLTGNLSSSEQEHIVAQFAQSGGILITTDAMTTAIPKVAAAIFYDLPLDPAVLDARIGQFFQVGIGGPVRFFAFADDSMVLIIEKLQRKLAEVDKALGKAELQKLVREALRLRGQLQP